MTRVNHIDELSHPVYKSFLFACQYLSLILLVTMLHPYIHNKDTHYSLSRRPLFPIGARNIPYLSLAINYQLKIKRFLLSHLTLLFSIQSTFRERRFTIHLKYFLQIYPLKIWWIQKKVVPLHPLKKTKL